MSTQLGVLPMQAAFCEGSSPLDLSGNTSRQGIYLVEAVQRYVFGQRWLDVDGRVFKYSGSKSAVSPGYGAANGTAASAIINSVTPAAYVVGDETILVTVASDEGYAGTGLVAANELAGGYVTFGHGAEAGAQTRRILKNTAVAANGGTTTLKLDGPVGYAVAAGGACEVQLNPYAYLKKGALEYNAFMCVPATYVSAADKYFWGQSWGPCWMVPGGGDTTPGNTANDRTAYFVGDGSVNFGYALVIESGYQKAGFCIDSTSGSVSAMPLVMLQISI